MPTLLPPSLRRSVLAAAAVLAIVAPSAVRAQSFELARTISSPAGGEFGHRVVAAGSKLLITAQEFGANPYASGAGYLYDGGSGALLQTFLNPAPGIFSRLGRAAASSADTIVLASQDGPVYLYDAGTGALLRTLVTPNRGLTESVAWIDGKVAVGAPYEEAVYVFDPATGGLLATLRNPTPAPEDWFGETVAAAGSNILVGTPGDDTSGTDAGAVYLFDGATGALLQSFFNPHPDAGRNMGWSLAAVGNRVLAGAPNVYGPAAPGAAHVFDQAAGSLVFTVDDPTPRKGEAFGWSVAARGNDLLIGAPGDGSGALVSGAVYLYDGGDGTLRHIFVSPTRGFESFGSSVAALAAGVLIGAESFDGGGGAAYQFVDACGNGALDACESCDDGNRLDGDGCSADCRLESCGNGTHETGESCDDGNTIDGDGCDGNCTITGCGNCRAALGEVCDDGNAIDDDGCDHDCTLTICGNGIVTLGEACDDGNLTPGDGCSPECSREACGNGPLDAGESCDDGNTVDGDGCSAICHLEWQKLDWFQVVRSFYSERPTADGHFYFADASDGKVLATAPSPYAGWIQIFDVATGRLLQAFTIPVDPGLVSVVYAGAAIFHGDTVAIRARLEAPTGESTMALYVFDADTAALLHQFFPAALGYDSDLAAFGPDLVVATASAKTVVLVDADTGALVRSFVDPQPERGRTFGSSIGIDGGDLLIGAPGASGGAVYRFDGATGQHRQTYLPPSGAVESGFGARVAMVGSDVLVASDHVVYRLSAASGALRAAFRDPTGQQFSAFGAGIAARGDDVLVTAPAFEPYDGEPIGTLFLFDGHNGRLLARSDAHNTNPRVLGDRIVVGIFSYYGTEQIDLLRPCSDGTLEPGEECDDGNGIDGDGCDRNCTATACGNGILTDGELCDDGNRVSDDGCDNDCRPTFACAAVPISHGSITIRRGRIRSGDESLVLTGSMSAPTGGFTLAPEVTGAQVLIEDVGASEARLLDLTVRTAPVPPGTIGTGCHPSDGWRRDRRRKRHVYRNQSTALDPPICTPGSANGLYRMTFFDRRPAHGRIDFAIRTRRSNVATPVGPLRATITLGSDAEAATTAHCGSFVFRPPPVRASR